MPPTSHPVSSARPTPVGRSGADATADQEAGRLPEGKTVLFYPSSGYGLLWSVLSLPGEIVVMADYLPRIQPKWCNWQQFGERIERDFAQHGIAMEVEHHDAVLFRFRAGGKTVWLFFEDNNDALDRIAEAGGRIQTMVGICDGCSEGGNYECVNDSLFLTAVLAIATPDFRLYLDHSRLLEDKDRGWFHGGVPRHAYFHESKRLSGPIPGTLALANLLVAPRLQKVSDPWKHTVTEDDLVLFPSPHAPSGLRTLVPFRTVAQRRLLAEYRFEPEVAESARDHWHEPRRGTDRYGFDVGSEYPPFAVLHVPHASTTIPPEVRGQFVLNDEDLQREVLRMTDHETDTLFLGSAQEATVLRAPACRLVVDVERFASDADEPMAAKGMGAIYTRTTDGLPLRRPLTPEERNQLLQDYYHPHHLELEQAVSRALNEFQRALVLDCHSFPDPGFPHEAADVTPRPDICIGTDDFHTPALLREAMVRAFRSHGFSVTVNHPYAGALVPLAYYQKDARVMAVMVEVNRRLYLDEATGRIRPDAVAVQNLVSTLCQQVTALFFRAPRRGGGQSKPR